MKSIGSIHNCMKLWNRYENETPTTHFLQCTNRQIHVGRASICENKSHKVVIVNFTESRLFRCHVKLMIDWRWPIEGRVQNLATKKLCQRNLNQSSYNSWNSLILNQKKNRIAVAHYHFRHCTLCLLLSPIQWPEWENSGQRSSCNLRKYIFSGDSAIRFALTGLQSI